MTNRITITLPDGALSPELQAAVGTLVLRLVRAAGAIGLEFTATDAEALTEGDNLPRETDESDPGPAPTRNNGGNGNGRKHILPPDLERAVNTRRPRTKRAAPAAKAAKSAAKQSRSAPAKSKQTTGSAGRRWTPEQLKKFQDSMARRRAEKTQASDTQGQSAQSDEGPNLTAAPTVGQDPVSVAGPQPMTYLPAMNQLSTLSKLRRQSLEVAPFATND